MTAAGVLNLLNGVNQDVTASGRIGNKITIKSIQWILWIQYTGNTNITSLTPVGWDGKIFVDTQSNGANPAATDVNTVAGVPTLLNLNNRRRFVVIKHKTSPFFAPNAGTTIKNLTPAVATWKGYKKMNMDVIYKGTDTTIGSIASNGLFMLTHANAGTNEMVMYGLVRIRYVDA